MHQIARSLLDLVSTFDIHICFRMEQVGIELQACSDHILHAAFVHIMEAWQVFDASTPELLSHLQILQSRTSVDEPRCDLIFFAKAQFNYVPGGRCSVEFG